MVDLMIVSWLSIPVSLAASAGLYLLKQRF